MENQTQNTNPQPTPQQRLPLQNEQQNEPQAPQRGNGPADTLRDGPLKASIWHREVKDKDYFNTEFAKTYKDKDGELKDTKSFGDKDLLGIAELARRAHNRTIQLKREAFKTRRQAINDQSRSQQRSK